MTTTFTSISALVEGHQAHLGVSDADLASALDYEQAAVVTLIKDGRMRLPFTKVPALAKALSIDPRVVLRLAMEEAAPGLYDLVEQIMNPLSLAKHEIGLINHCRKLAGKHLTAFVVVCEELQRA